MTNTGHYDSSVESCRQVLQNKSGKLISRQAHRSSLAELAKLILQETVVSFPLVPFFPSASRAVHNSVKQRKLCSFFHRKRRQKWFPFSLMRHWFCALWPLASRAVALRQLTWGFYAEMTSVSCYLNNLKSFDFQFT